MDSGHRRVFSGRARLARLLAQAALLSFVWTLTLAVPAHAYIDPGSGALLLQALLAGLFGAMFFLRDSIKKAARWVGSKLTGKSLENAEPPAPKTPSQPDE